MASIVISHLTCDQVFFSPSPFNEKRKAAWSHIEYCQVLTTNLSWHSGPKKLNGNMHVRRTCFLLQFKITLSQKPLIARISQPVMYRYYRSRLPVGYAGWVENVVDSSWFDQINMNRFPCCRFAMPEVDLRDTNPCELSRNVKCLTEVCCHDLRTRKIYVSLFHRSWLPLVWVDALQIESNGKVPQRNPLSLGALDMDAFLMQCYFCASNINEKQEYLHKKFWTLPFQSFGTFLLFLSAVHNNQHDTQPVACPPAPVQTADLRDERPT